MRTPGATSTPSGQVPGPADSHAQLVRERLLRRMFVMGPPTVLTALASAIAMAGVFFGMTRGYGALAWGVAICTLLCLRLVFMRWNARLYPEPEFTLRQPDGAWRFMLPLGAYMSMWTLAPWALMPPGTESPMRILILLLGMFAVLMGSVPVIATWRAMVPVVTIPLTLGVVTRFAWMGGTDGWFTCVVGLLFGGSMARYALSQHQLIRRSLSDQIDKELLSEQLLRQSFELQRLNRERSRFFASASHDLRQPVHALALFSRSLERDLADHPLAPVAGRVVQATDAVSGLLNAMLDISKIDAGTVVPQPVRMAVDPLFLRLSQIFEPRTQQAGLALRFHTAPEWLQTDGDLLLRVLTNFVDNALKYTRQGGILVSARPRGDRLRLAVWDTGLGIAPEHLPHVFDEFYQVDNPQRDVARGLGIGLAIVKGWWTCSAARSACARGSATAACSGSTCRAARPCPPPRPSRPRPCPMPRRPTPPNCRWCRHACCCSTTSSRWARRCACGSRPTASASKSPAGSPMPARRCAPRPTASTPSSSTSGSPIRRTASRRPPNCAGSQAAACPRSWSLAIPIPSGCARPMPAGWS